MWLDRLEAFLAGTDDDLKAVERAGVFGDELRRCIGEGPARRRQRLNRVAIDSVISLTIAVRSIA